MRVLLTRHGETLWNVAGQRQGQLDSPLTSQGREHAAQLQAILQDELLDLICSSPLGRAVATASPIADDHGLDVTVVDSLAEFDMGAFSGLTNEAIEDQFPGVLAQRKLAKYSWRFPHGESYQDVDIRAASALRLIEARDPKVLLIVSHSMITRMLLRNLLDLDPKDALKFNMPHGAVVDVRPGRRTPIRWIHP